MKNRWWKGCSKWRHAAAAIIGNSLLLLVVPLWALCESLRSIPGLGQYHDTDSLQDALHSNLRPPSLFIPFLYAALSMSSCDGEPEKKGGASVELSQCTFGPLITVLVVPTGVQPSHLMPSGRLLAASLPSDRSAVL
jgi:hypothetical protein